MSEEDLAGLITSEYHPHSLYKVFVSYLRNSPMIIIYFVNGEVLELDMTKIDIHDITVKFDYFTIHSLVHDTDYMFNSIVKIIRYR